MRVVRLDSSDIMLALSYNCIGEVEMNNCMVVSIIHAMITSPIAFIPEWCYHREKV